MFYLLRLEPIESVAGLATALVGLLLYFCARTARNDNAPHENASLEEERTFPVCRENRKRRSSARTHDASANGTRKLRTRSGVRRGSAALFLAIISANVLNVSAQENPQIAHAPFRWLQQLPDPMILHGFLAGMPVPENSPLAPLTRDPAWQAHSAFFRGRVHQALISVNSKSCTRGKSLISRR